MANQELREKKQLLTDIDALYKKIGLQNPFQGLNARDLGIEELRTSFQELNSELVNMDGELGDLTKGFRAVLDEVNATGNSFNASKSALTSITGIASKLRDNQQQITNLSVKEMSTLQSKLESAKETLSQNRAGLDQQEKELRTAIKNRENVTANVEKLAKLQNLQKNINGLLNEQDSILAKVIEKNQVDIKNKKEIEGKLGVTGGLLKGISKIPLLGDIFDANEALDVAHKKIDATKSSLSGLGAAFKNIGQQAITGLFNPANLTLMVFTQMISALKSVDTGAGDMAKGMNMTYSEALGVRRELGGIAAASSDVALNTKGLQETYMAIGNTLGSNAMINEEDLKTFTKLREQAGLTNDELMGIQKLSLVNGKTLESNTKEILGAAAAYNVKNKLALNEKTILKDVNLASASLKLSLGGSADQIAIAASKAREFGVNLQQAEAMSQSLLNFESSIENELSAELITGRDLNLERARGLALNGDTAAAAAEIAKQVGNSTQFGKMNVIQQEAIAKAAGMERNELAQSLIDREALSKLSVKDAKTAQEAYNTLKAQGKSEEEITKILGDKKLANMYEQQSVQERFNNSIEKLKEIFVSLATPVLEIVSPFAKLVGWLAESKVLLASISGLMAGIAAYNVIITANKVIQEGLAIRANALAAISLARAIGIAVANSIANPLAAAVGLVVAAGVGAMVYNSMKTTKDGEIDARKGLIVSGEFGSVQLNEKDTFIGNAKGGKAGTNLLGESNQSTLSPQTNQIVSPKIDMSAIVNELKQLRSDMKNLINRPIQTSVNVDGKQIAMATGNNSQQFYDSSGKSNYRTQ